MGKHSKEKRRQYKRNRRIRLKEKKESELTTISKAVQEDQQEDINTNQLTHLDTVHVECNVNSNKDEFERDFDKKLENDGLYVNMMKYFKKRNGYLKFKKMLEMPKEDDFGRNVLCKYNYCKKN